MFFWLLAFRREFRRFRCFHMLVNQEDVNPCRQAQSLIFDGLVVEATLAREMAEERKRLSSEALPTLLASHFDTSQSMSKPLCIVWIFCSTMNQFPSLPNVEMWKARHLDVSHHYSFALASSQKRRLVTKQSTVFSLENWCGTGGRCKVYVVWKWGRILHPPFQQDIHSVFKSLQERTRWCSKNCKIWQ